MVQGGTTARASRHVSNVAGENVGTFIGRWFQQAWSQSPVWAKSQKKGFGVVNGYDRPEQLGVDRWVCLIAARQRHLGPACVADCGTALTLDLLDGDGEHRGGLIVPGLHLMRESLSRRTVNVREYSGVSSGPWAKNTADAVVGGTLLTLVAVIERFVRDSAAGLVSTPPLLITGGDAQAISERLDIPFVWAPQLVLEGLSIVAEGDS